MCVARGPERSEVFDVERVLEACEQMLAAAEYDRRDRGRPIVHLTCREHLPDDVGAAHDLDVLVAGGSAGARGYLVASSGSLSSGPIAKPVRCQSA